MACTSDKPAQRRQNGQRQLCGGAFAIGVSRLRDHLPAQAHELCQRWFPERQMILRQRESVSAIRFSPHAQLLAACVLVAGGVWTIATTTICFRTLLHSTVFEAMPDRSQDRPADRPATPGITSLQDRANAFAGSDPLLSDRRMAALERALGAVQRRLEEAQTQLRSVVEERDGLAGRLADTERRMRAADAEHADTVSRLTRETRKSIAEVERIIGATSVDPAKLIPHANAKARGGPFVPWSDRGSAPSAARSASPDDAASTLARLDALARLLGTIPLAAPLQDFAITSPFGRRIDPFSGQGAMHEGIDFAAPRHTPVTATAPGRVVFAGRQGAYGLMVEIEHGPGLRTRYAHLDRIDVAPGQTLALDQKIGVVGATGRASGPHVHYEILVDGRPHDPLNFLKATSHARDAAQQH